MSRVSTVCTIGDQVYVEVIDKFQRFITDVGVIRFIGERESQIGTYYGIRLQSSTQNNNGTLHTVEDFKTTCTAKKVSPQHLGTDVFVKRNKIWKVLQKATKLRVTVGDVVWIEKKKCKALIRFIGFTQFGANKATDIWYGVQLEKPNGKNNGIINGRRYFKCLPKYGLFIKASQITSHSHIIRDIYGTKAYDAEEVQIVMVLQKWLRHCLGFSYDVGNKYHFMLSGCTAKLIKYFTLQHYDTCSAVTRIYFQLKAVDKCQKLYKVLKGIKYEYYDGDDKWWCGVELYLNEERECRNLNTGYVGTWNVVEKEQLLYVKFITSIGVKNGFMEKYFDHRHLTSEQCGSKRTDIRWSHIYY